MKPLMEKVVALNELAEAQPATAPTYPDGLTEREMEVLRILTTGKTNREIAEELVLSVKTVDRHVSNIFNKTGATNRTEATVYASRHNLVSL